MLWSGRPRARFVEAEALEHFVDARVSFEAALGGEAMREFVVSRGHLGLHLGFARHARFELAEFVLDRVEVGERETSLVADTRLGTRIDLLSQQADRSAAGGRDTTRIRIVVAACEAKQGRLAGAVRPHQPDAISGADVEGHAFEEQTAGDAAADVVELEERRGHA